MRVLEANFRRKYAKIRVENPLDLWHLSYILKPGDLITAKTLRTIFIERWGEREKAKRKLVTLTIQLEKLEFQAENNKLRLTGKIVEAPKEVRLGSYHTIETSIGTVLFIEKEWAKEEIERLERARRGLDRVREPTIIDEFFVHLAKGDELAVYGFEDVKNAALAGAIKILLIPSDKIKDKRIDEILKIVEEKRGKIKFVFKSEPLGKKFCSSYDIAAILRFRIS